MQPKKTPLRFGEFRLDREASELFRGEARVRLQEKPLQVLRLLVEHAGQLVTRDELRHHLWAADTYVDFDRNLNTAVKKLRIALGDSAEQPRYVETIPRRGYRLIMPVSTDALSAAGPVLPSSAPAGVAPQTISSVAGSGTRPWLARVSVAASVAAAVLLAFALGGVWKFPWAAPSPVLAVMAIKHNPPQHSFSEGVAQGLVRSLQSSTPGVRVVGSRAMASFACSGNAIADLARELGVTHVVNGSVDRSSTGVLLTVRLIRASDQSLVASESIEIQGEELDRAETSAVQRMTRMVTKNLL